MREKEKGEKREGRDRVLTPQNTSGGKSEERGGLHERDWVWTELVS